MATRFIGGEAGHRSVFGGTRTKPQIIGYSITLLVGVMGVMFFGWRGLAAGVVLGVAVYFTTTDTSNGSYWERRKRRNRWKGRKAAGTDRFIPYTDQAWAQAQEQAAEHQKPKDQAKVLGAVRERPDGADGMGWLDARPNRPGIAWHTPQGEEAYLSVAFGVSGQLRGAESSHRQESTQAGFGSLLARCAPQNSLVRGFQCLVRVLPPDLALNEAWVVEHLDPEAPADAVESYQQVLERTGEGTYVQRHIIVARWPLSEQFMATAARYGKERAGWRALMKSEIQSMERSLRAAKMGTVRALSARGVVAMMLHQQNPDRQPLMVGGIDPRCLGLPSHDVWNAHWVTDTNPSTGEDVSWGHRTARITAANVETGPRSPYWFLSLLRGGGSGGGVRSLSFGLELIPAQQARVLASRDIVRDTSAAISRAQKGQLADSDTDVTLQAAQARGSDLRPGSGHHGVNWIGHITISARTQAELTEASRQLEETAANEAGIQKLEWLDSYQAAASGTTWPIARGLHTGHTTLGTKVMDRLAGNGEKEEQVA